jgi:hypothetical protein
MAFDPETFLDSVEKQVPPKTLFEIRQDTEGEITMAGPGYVPPDVKQSLDGLFIEVADLKTIDGQAQFVGVNPKDISKALFDQGGNNLAAEFWNGFAHAFMAYHGQPSEAEKRGTVFFPVNNGAFYEVAPTEQEVEDAQRKGLAAVLAGMLKQRQGQLAIRIEEFEDIPF